MTKELKEKLKKQEQLNIELAQILKSQGIKRFYITTVGNSLATGYSEANKTIPLLERNHSLKIIFINNGIEPNVYAFTRQQNNNDEHIHSWYHTSETEKERFKFNRLDAINLKYFTKEELKQYCPENPERNDNLKEVLNTAGTDVANFLVYSGATGSFLDNVTRGGLFKSLSGFKRDFKYLEMTLREIQGNNIKTDAKTQVFLVGVPNYKGLGLTEKFINRHLRKIAEKYSNVTYVDAVYGKFFYKNGVDVHLNEEEYTDYNNSVINSASENYISTNNKINIDKDIYELSQIVSKNLIEDKDNVDKAIQDYLSKYLPSLEGLDYDISDYIKNIKNYIYNNLPRELKEYQINYQNKILNLEYPEIIVYNAKTGEVTSNADTEVNNRIFGTIDKDFINIENLMTNTLAENRKQNKNTQVYVIGTNQKEIDKKLKEIASNYINVVFIEPRVTHVTESSSEEEKTEYINQINESINTNYEEVQNQIEVDRRIVKINEEIELLGIEKEKVQEQKPHILSKVNKYMGLVGDKKHLRKYLLERAPYDFFFVGKKEIKHMTR